MKELKGSKKMSIKTKRQYIAEKVVREEMEVCEGLLNEAYERHLKVSKILFANGFISEEEYEKVKKDYSTLESYRV
jgi:uncharacterized membrane protein